MDQTRAVSVLIVGLGAMGKALAERLAVAPSDEAHSCFELTAVEPHLTSPEGAPDGVTHHLNIESLPADRRFDLVLFAVKPQIIARVAPAYADRLGPDGAFVSIAAGVSLAALGERLPGAPLVRAMPNLPARVGHGVTGLASNGGVSETARARVDAFFVRVGRTIWVADDDAIDRVTAIAGSGPGYVFALLEAYAEAAVGLGFAPEEAAALTQAVFEGSLALMAASGETPAVLCAQVTSPNGTTAAGLAALDAEGALEPAFARTFAAAYARAKALSAPMDG